MALPVFLRGVGRRPKWLFPRVFKLGLLPLGAALALLWLTVPGPWSAPDGGQPAGGTVARDPAATFLPDERQTDPGRDPDRQAGPAADAQPGSAARVPEPSAGPVPGEEPGPGDEPSLEAAPGAAKASNDDAPSPDEEPPPGLAIAGSVLDDRGHLLPGITVSATPLDTPGAGDGPGTAQSRVTDEFGMFRIEGIAEGEYDLEANGGETYRPARERVRAGVASAELRLQRVRTVTVVGMVSDTAGRPLGGVRIRALGEQSVVTTETAGLYEVVLEPAKAGQPPVLEFTRDGFRDERRRVEAATSDERDTIRLDVRLEPSEMKVIVFGRVEGPRGEAVPDARVWLSSADPGVYRRSNSDANGDFLIEGVEIGDAYRLGVEPGEGYRPAVSDLFPVGPDDTRHDIRLEEGGEAWLSGRLVDPEGAPLGDFLVWLESDDARDGPLALRSDATGRFEPAPVPAGELQLRTRSQPHLGASGIAVLPGESRDVIVPLDWGPHWLFGQVVDGDGQPVAGARVVLQWGRQYPDVYSTSRREASTDRLGYFTFSNLGGGEHVLTVLASGFNAARAVHDPRTAPDDMRIALQRPGEPNGGGGQ